MKKFIALCLLAFSLASHAEGDLLMSRSQQTFPEAMLSLQSTIKSYGYTISRVQRVDIGLTKSGYKTDKYRIVFFGKASEVNAMVARYPDIMAYLPLKIAIFAEGSQTVMVTMNPGVFRRLGGPASEEAQFARWENDVRAIMSEMRQAGEER